MYLIYQITERMKGKKRKKTYNSFSFKAMTSDVRVLFKNGKDS